MVIQRLRATFGCLEQQELSLSDGLNIIQAPNESGKSTWSAFLHVMFYGFGKGKGPLSEKNRYQPWNGRAMQGSLTADGITITRSTARAAKPMDHFEAVYSDTAEPVPGLTAANCGERLLGISPEVFDRSLFVRQSGLGIDQSAELERRIAALISTGEEDSSYSETAAVLRRQCNRRRSNSKTGLLPTLEQEILRQETALEQLNALHSQWQAARSQEQLLSQRQQLLQQALQLHDLADYAQQYDALSQAQRQLQQAQGRIQLLEQQSSALPGRDELEQIKARLALLADARQAEEAARSVCGRGERTQEDAARALAASPFAGKEEQQAREEAEDLCARLTAPASAAARLLGAAALLFLLAAALFLLLRQLLPAAALGFAALLLGGSAWIQQRRQRSGRQLFLQQLNKRFGTQQPEALLALAQEYGTLLTACRQAEENCRNQQAALQAQHNAAEALQQELAPQLQRLKVQSTDPAAASAAVEQALQWHALLEQERQQAQALQTRCQLLQQQLARFPAAPAQPSAAVQRPEQSRQQLQLLQQENAEQLEAQRQQLHRLEGQIRSLGDSAALQSDLALKRQQRQQLQNEYDALIMAMDVLAQANAVLQSRFSPALGQEAARIFSAMTGGKYEKVLLSRDFSVAAEAAGDPVFRSASVLSQGTADQLYLAVRLAICHLVLPADRRLPLILDDAFSNFDDRRLEGALDYLCREAQQRQILLFTCHSREARMLQGKSGVHCITLDKTAFSEAF